MGRGPTKSELRQAARNAGEAFRRQYGKDLGPIRPGKMDPETSLQVARLAGVMLKADYSDEVELPKPSARTGARFAYRLKDAEIREGGALREQFFQSGAAAVYNALDPYAYDPVDAAVHAASEGETAAWIIEKVQSLLCTSEKRPRSVVKDLILPTTGSLSSVVSLAGWLAGNVSVLALAPPAVIINVAIYIIGQGLDGFCVINARERLCLPAKEE